MPTPDARIIGLDGLSRQARTAMVGADLPLQESTVLNTTGMCAGTSPHCSQPRATRCIGLAPYHEMHEIDRFVEALTRVASADIGPQPAAVVR